MEDRLHLLSLRRPGAGRRTGRAIYNDVDQIYLADPAALFDLNMHGKGQLGINERENSVMLLDCEAMSRIWHYAAAQRGEKHKEFRAAVHAAGLWGPLPGVWNARDGEYVAGESKLLHFTTLQTQPWQPFPHQLRYEEHPLAEVWRALEVEADVAGFTKEALSRPDGELLALTGKTHERGNGRLGRSAPPTVWVLADDKLGHTTQSVGLAEALGWPYTTKELRFNALDAVADQPPARR